MYLWLQIVHILAVIIWMGGMLAAAAHGVLLSNEPKVSRQAVILFRWYRRLVTPAMIVALGTGIWAAQMAGWFSAPWLQAKLVFVFAMTALHGMVSGQLRRLALPDAPDGTVARVSRRLIALGWWSAILLAFIVILAVRKLVF